MNKSSQQITAAHKYYEKVSATYVRNNEEFYHHCRP